MNQQTIEGLLRQGSIDEAIVACQAVLQVTPSNARILGYLGMCYFRKQDFQAAIDAFKRATILDPNFVDAGVKHAQCLDRMCRYAEAYEVANEWLHAQPANHTLRCLVDQLQQYAGGPKQGWERTVGLNTTVHFGGEG